MLSADAFLIVAVAVTVVLIRRSSVCGEISWTDPSMGGGLAAGIAIGIALGVALHNIGLGIAVGIAIGVGLGGAQQTHRRDE